MAALTLALATSFALAVSPLLIAAAVVVLLILAALLRVLLVLRKLRRAARRGRTASVVAPGVTPLVTFNHAGRSGDPINVQILATNGQIGAAFAAAGWYRADEIDLFTAVRISVDSVLGRAYSTAPVSNLYLYGSKEDLAFERPGRTVRERDHIRFWNTGSVGSDNRPIWVGSGTRDVKVELSKTDHLPTHGISPDLDAERDLVVSELALTGYVIADGTRPGFGRETHGTNGGGDPYVTDGQVTVLTLANVWTLPLARHVRGPLGARARQILERLLRVRLPKVGLERAARERERRIQPASVRTDAR
jgi:hypothetical protein